MHISYIEVPAVSLVSLSLLWRRIVIRSSEQEKDTLISTMDFWRIDFNAPKWRFWERFPPFRPEPKVKVLTHVIGHTLNFHKDFVMRLVSKTEVREVEECNVIVAFCPISSQMGPDIEAALKQIPDNKPTVVVAMHHTHNPESIVPENGRYKNSKTQHIVHCLFHENEGLLKCTVTNEAVEYTQRILRQHAQDSAATVPPESSSAACAGIEGGGTGTQEHPTGDEGFVMVSVAAVPPESSSAACAGIEGGGTGTQEHPTRDEGFVMVSVAAVPPESSSAACAGIEGGGMGTQEHPTGDEGFVMNSAATVPPESSSAACAGIEGGGMGTQEHPTGDEGLVMNSAATVPPESSSAACAGIEGGGMGTQEHPTGDEGLVMNSAATVPPESSSAACAGIEGGGMGTQEHPTGDEGLVMKQEPSSRQKEEMNGSEASPHQPPPLKRFCSVLWNSTTTSIPGQNPKIHIFTVVTGNTLNSHKTFLEHLAAKLTEVKGVEECDVIVAFCPISSRMGTDIEEALQQIPDNKPTVVVAMHHTHNPESIVPENGRYKNSKTQHIVHCLFHENEGLLKCTVTNEAVEYTQRILRQHAQDSAATVPPESSSAACAGIEGGTKGTQDPAEPKVKVLTRAIGNTLNFHKDFVMRLVSKTEVREVEECNVIVAFCPISSRMGTDIEAALKQIPDNKPTVVVAMHHTHNPESIVPENGRYKNSKTQHIVHCLFHENEGLLKCSVTNEAVEYTQRILRQHAQVVNGT
ncbi:hypothetical protein AGOR_G00084490 [Albula goreensis]|uniref:Uncharacterized protein n=1 Tax=Albula goreensis TaxID=1534307 RepID=A0A8T3DQH0_9TELE|nr:hypothetical protein AGOR_G00084490 [Albula goreensis]